MLPGRCITVAAELNLTLMSVTIDACVFPREMSAQYWMFWRVGNQERGYMYQGNGTEMESKPMLWDREEALLTTCTPLVLGKTWENRFSNLGDTWKRSGAAMWETQHLRLLHSSPVWESKDGKGLISIKGLFSSRTFYSDLLLGSEGPR